MAAAPGGHLSIYFDALDHFKHLAMKYHPPQLSAVTDEDFAKYHFIVEAAYRLHDLFLGTYIESQPEANTFLISDHGFRSGGSVGPLCLIMPARQLGTSILWHIRRQRTANPCTRAAQRSHAARYCPDGVGDAQPQGLAGDGGPLARVLAHTDPGGGAESAPQAVEQGRSPQMEEELLDTLVKLGYLEAQDRAQGGARLVENGYYLARSLRAQQRPREACKCCNP